MFLFLFLPNSHLLGESHRATTTINALIVVVVFTFPRNKAPLKIALYFQGRVDAEEEEKGYAVQPMQWMDI